MNRLDFPAASGIMPLLREGSHAVPLIIPRGIGPLPLQGSSIADTPHLKRRIGLHVDASTLTVTVPLSVPASGGRTIKAKPPILRAAASNPRDHLIYSLALGTGLRLAEIVGLDVGDVYTSEARPRNRLKIRPEIAKGAVTNVYRIARDLFLAQRFSWHVNPLTTTVYTHPGDQELFERVRGLS